MFKNRRNEVNQIRYKIDAFLISFSSKIEAEPVLAEVEEKDDIFNVPPPKLERVSSNAQPKVPKSSPKSVVEVDGFEATVERTPMFYEKIEDIFDELPEFAQEIVASHYLRDSKSK